MMQTFGQPVQVASSRLCDATGHGCSIIRQVRDLPHKARLEPIAMPGNLVTVLGTAGSGLRRVRGMCCGRGACLGRGVSTPVRKALLAAAVTPATCRRAFGFERMRHTGGNRRPGLLARGAQASDDAAVAAVGGASLFHVVRADVEPLMDARPTRRFAVAACFAILSRMAKAKANKSVRDIGGKPALAARAGVWPASSRRFRQVQTLH